jgi:hypothetical protein
MGLVLLTLTVFFILDVCGVWDLSAPRRTVPVAGGGLVLVVVTVILTQGVRTVRALRARRRRRTRRPA